MKFASRKFPEFLFSPAWSPDGKKVICAARKVNSDRSSQNLLGVNVEDGKQVPAGISFFKAC